LAIEKTVGDAFKPRSDIDAVTIDVVAFDYDVVRVLRTELR